MSTLILLALIAPLVLFVIWPLFSVEVESSAVVESRTASLQRRKLDAYGAIKEAEFDREMGKLSDQDYASLVGRYRKQALEAMAALEAEPPPPRAKSAGGESAVNFCPACGAKAAAGNFCAACGEKLPGL